MSLRREEEQEHPKERVFDVLIIRDHPMHQLLRLQ